MKYAIIDAETNGLPDYKKPADDPSQPRLASLGVVMVDVIPSADPVLTPEIKVEAEHEFLVKPDGWKMTTEAAAVNGLTDERLAADGLDVRDVLQKYATLIEAGYVVVAYGAQHDCKIMRGEFRRAGLPDRFEITKNVCLMRAVQPLKIPKTNGKGGWPQLDDVLRHIGQKPEPRPHGSLVGARSAFAVFSHFLPKGVLPEPSVHHAKNPPMKTK
jgi:DNA polymerase III epsilon subunit-like protein